MGTGSSPYQHQAGWEEITVKDKFYRKDNQGNFVPVVTPRDVRPSDVTREIERSTESKIIKIARIMVFPPIGFVSS